MQIKLICSLLQVQCSLVKMLVTGPCLTLSDHMDCSLPGSVHDLQAKILESGLLQFFQMNKFIISQLETITTSSHCMFSFCFMERTPLPQTPPPVYFLLFRKLCSHFMTQEISAQGCCSAEKSFLVLLPSSTARKKAKMSSSHSQGLFCSLYLS